MSDQLQLEFEPTCYVVPVCDICRRPIGKVPMDNASDWNEPFKWAYIALVQHDREHHPEETATTRAEKQRGPEITLA